MREKNLSRSLSRRCIVELRAGCHGSAEKVKLKIWSGTTYATAAAAVQDEQIMAWAEKNNVELDYARMSVDERQPRWKTALESKQFPDMTNRKFKLPDTST